MANVYLWGTNVQSYFRLSINFIQKRGKVPSGEIKLKGTGGQVNSAPINTRCYLRFVNNNQKCHGDNVEM